MSIEAMKQALEFIESVHKGEWSGSLSRHQVRETLNKAIAEAEKQEPVAWIVEDEHGERLEWAGDADSVHGTPTFPLYTTPPQRQPLTDEQAVKVVQGVVSTSERPIGAVALGLLILRATEAEHGIKGEA